jgi:hypothetical protein
LFRRPDKVRAFLPTILAWTRKRPVSRTGSAGEVFLLALGEGVLHGADFLRVLGLTKSDN